MTFNQVVRGSNPRCLIKNASLKEAFFNVRHRRNRTPDNGVDRGVDVRGTSAKRGPKRSVERIPDVSLA